MVNAAMTAPPVEGAAQSGMGLPFPVVSRPQKRFGNVQTVNNVAAGGSLYQDLANELPGSIKHDYFPFSGQGYARDYLAHDVSVVAGSRLANLVGTGPLRVNSMHHQGVKELGRGLHATAESPDGLVEALEGDDDGYLFAVQWHPEALTDSDARTRDLFAGFIEAGAEWRHSHD